MPSMVLSELLERNKLGLLPAGEVAASVGALAASLGKGESVISEESLLPGVPDSAKDDILCSKLLPTLP